MEEIYKLTLKILELEKNICDEKLLNDKKIQISKLLSEIKNLNNKIIDYATKIDNVMCDICDHVYEDYFEKYERTKKKCIHCEKMLY